MPAANRLKSEIRICQYCGKPYEPQRENQKYCSEGCGSLHHGHLLVKPEKICVQCGSTFQASARKTLYCSQKCRQDARNIKKGLKVTKDYWKELRDFVLERDNFTCQDCGVFKMEIGLVVHHIKPLYKGGINKPENCIALCDKCHKKRHGL